MLSIFLLLTLFHTALAASSGNVVDLGYVQYAGNQSYPNTVAYLGIPYAEPPLGDLRFRAPEPLNTTRISEGTQGQVVNTTSYPEFCIQGTTGAGDAGGAGSEDCLKINVYVPYGAQKGDNLPVLFYIHGGGYIYGNPANWPFDDWIHQSPNVVIASVYYRLDSFGFLATPEFSNGTLGDFNAGFRDQIQALKWVNQYIDAFGGDPTKVTINGQSAGGSSVELHLTAHEGQNLFRGAIAQSVFRGPLPTPQQQQPLFEYYAEQAGCGGGSAETQMACLRNASVSVLARAQDSAYYNFTGPYNLFHPALDGTLFTEYPTTTIAKGESRRVPIIVGATSNETLASGDTVDAALQAYFPALTQDDLDAFAAAYPPSNFSSEEEYTRVATGEPSVRCARDSMGGPYSLFAQAWTYRYNQRNPTQNASDLSVEHAAENWMMFRGTNTGYNGTTTFSPQTPVELAFTEELIAYWLSFVRSLNPNTYKLERSPSWSRYTYVNKTRIALQQDPQNSTTVSGIYMETESPQEAARCAVVTSKMADEED